MVLSKLIRSPVLSSKSIYIVNRDTFNEKNLLAVALMATSAFASSAFASDGAVNFTGSITDAACTVDTASQNRDVFWATSRVQHSR